MGTGTAVGFLIVTSISLSLSPLLELTDSLEALLKARPPCFFFEAAAGGGFFLAAAFLAAAAAANLAAPELFFCGLKRGGLGLGTRLFFEAFEPDAVVALDFFLLNSVSLSLLSLKMLLYLSTVLKLLDPRSVFDLPVVVEAPLSAKDDDVLFDVIDEVVGVDEGFTEGEAWDPGEDEAAMAAFLAF